jgi:hypothetical protein
VWWWCCGEGSGGGGSGMVVVVVNVGVTKRARRVAASYVYEASQVSVYGQVMRACVETCESTFTLHFDSSQWQTSNADAPQLLVLPHTLWRYVLSLSGKIARTVYQGD